MMMHYPELYQNTSDITKRDIKILLENNIAKIKWNRYNDKIIDIGSGDGGATVDILRKYLPNDFVKLYGSDKSESMVNFANQHHSDEKTSFILLDIEGHLSEELERSFDHAFSFYALHWIRNHEVSFSNIYNLLTDGGDCLLSFIGHTPVFSVFRALSQHMKWRPWFKDVENFVSVHQDVLNPVDEVKLIMQKTGFKNIEVKNNEYTYVFEKKEEFINLIEAINPFIIPSGLENEFRRQISDIVLDIKGISYFNGGLKMEYKLIECYGSK